MMADVFIGLGSNLASPVRQLHQALASLASLAKTSVIKISSFYKSKAWGPIQEQPDFINAVAWLQTELSPSQLFMELKKIERHQGRNLEAERWGPRCIDLDILFYGKESLVSDSLTIPHPRLGERDFVIYPLLELIPNFILPSGVSLVSLAEKCPSSLERLTEECL